MIVTLDYLCHLTHKRGLAQTCHGGLISVICMFDLAKRLFALDAALKIKCFTLVLSTIVEMVSKWNVSKISFLSTY